MKTHLILSGDLALCYCSKVETAKLLADWHHQQLSSFLTFRERAKLLSGHHVPLIEEIRRLYAVKPKLTWSYGWNGWMTAGLPYRIERIDWDEHAPET